MWFGIVLIVVGVVFLLQNLGFVTGAVWNIIWPVFIILIGISMVIKNGDRFNNNCCKEDKTKTDDK